MSRWYQHVLTGCQVEVKTLEEDDQYSAPGSNWVRIAPPPGATTPSSKRTKGK